LCDRGTVRNRFEPGSMLNPTWFDTGVYSATKSGCILALARIVDDPKGKPASIGKLLRRCQFEQQDFSNPRESQQIKQQAIAFSNQFAEHNIVKRIDTLRDKAVVHSDFDAYENPNIVSDNAVQLVEARNLLKELHQIVNTIVGYFRDERDCPLMIAVEAFTSMERVAANEVDAYLKLRKQGRDRWLASLGPDHAFNKDTHQVAVTEDL